MSAFPRNGKFARVLGGGCCTWFDCLRSRDPGIGKAAYRLQVAMQMANKNTSFILSRGEDGSSDQDARSTPVRRRQTARKSAFLVTETNLGHFLNIFPR